MNKLVKIKVAYLKEVILILLLLFVSNNFLHKKTLSLNNVPIYADGRGYYEYLPAFFIYKDLHLNYLDTLETEFYTVESTLPIFENIYTGERINKYYVGTALLQSPFFLIAHTIAKSSDKYAADGYSLIYQRWISYAGIFYLFLGMIFIRKFLQTYQINSWWIFFSQLMILFATPLLHYVIYAPAYSHVYSFFLITFFIFLVRKYFLTEKGTYILYALLVMGLIIIVRPINALIIIFTPFLIESFKDYLNKVIDIFKRHINYFLFGLLGFGLILSIQLYISYLQTGNPLSYNYGDEGFNFKDPHIIDFLFSYRKGFFLWTPFWFIVFVLGIIHLLFQKRYYHLISFIISFLFLVYILSSWHAWSYGGSIGQRPMIDFYGVFSFLLIPIFTHKLTLSKIGLILLAPILIYVMQIQIYQYIKAIISLDNMDKEKYWEVFLNTNEKYSWYFMRMETPVGDKLSDTLLVNELSFNKVESIEELPQFNLLITDSTAKIAELTFKINREADKEVFQVFLYDSLYNDLITDYCNFFYNQYDEKVIYRFQLPNNYHDIRKLKLVLTRVNEPIKIDSIRFLTYKSFN